MSLPAVAPWYDEVQDYRFTNTPWSDNGGNFGAIGHFTQVVWIRSIRLGCGVGLGSNCKVVACNYGPAGNVVGDSSFLANVRPRTSGSSTPAGNGSGSGNGTDSSGSGKAPCASPSSSSSSSKNKHRG